MTYNLVRVLVGMRLLSLTVASKYVFRESMEILANNLPHNPFNLNIFTFCKTS